MREARGRKGGGWGRGERLSNAAVTQLLVQTLVFMSVIDNRSYSHKSKKKLKKTVPGFAST